MGTDKDFNELFEGNFSDTEKAAVAKSVMKRQDRISSLGRIEIILSVLFCAVYLVIAFIMIINFREIVDREMDPRAVPTSRNSTGKAGVAEDVLIIISAPFAVLIPAAVAVSAERDKKLYREFKARKITVSAVTENEGIKGLYTVTANYNDNPICFNTTDSTVKNYAEGSIMIVVDFIAIKAGTYEKNYEYYTAEAEQRRRMTLEKVSNGKYIIIHI